jgi:hypothetical protein
LKLLNAHDALSVLTLHLVPMIPLSFVLLSLCDKGIKR